MVFNVISNHKIWNNLEKFGGMVKVMNIQFKLKINNCHIFITQIGYVTVYVIKKGIIFATLYQEQASMNICKLLTQCYKFYKMSNNVTYPL